MGFSTLDENQIPVEVRVDDKMIRVTFSGGLELATPVARFPRFAVYSQLPGKCRRARLRRYLR